MSFTAAFLPGIDASLGGAAPPEQDGFVRGEASMIRNGCPSQARPPIPGTAETPDAGNGACYVSSGDNDIMQDNFGRNGKKWRPGPVLDPPPAGMVAMGMRSTTSMTSRALACAVIPALVTLVIQGCAGG